MPRILDNLTPDSELRSALQTTLELSDHADFCVGYFNLRGWKHVDSYVEPWSGDVQRARVLVGMQRLPHDQLREALSLLDEPAIDNQAALRLKQRLAEEFRDQLVIGVPTNSDEAALQRLAKQLRAGKVAVKLFLRHPLHAKLYLCFRSDPISPVVGFLGSSNPTIYDSMGELRKPSELKQIYFKDALVRDAALGILNSSLFSWLVQCFSDCRNLNQREVRMIRFDVADITRLERLSAITHELMEDIKANSELKKQGPLTIQQTFPRQSKAIIDRLDRVLTEHYDFTDEELDFIINYDIKYRMGRDG